MTPAFEPLHDAVEADHERVFLVHRDRLLVAETGDGGATALTRDRAEELTGQPPSLVLGRLGDTLYWASELPDPEALPEGTRLEGLRSLHGHLDDHEWNIGGRATQIADWHRDHQFCGRCADKMARAPGERAMHCPSCGYTAYPRLSPAVIVLIEHPDGRALLGRSGRWDIPMYSTLAGFVEAGESLEDTVHREIRGGGRGWRSPTCRTSRRSPGPSPIR